MYGRGIPPPAVVAMLMYFRAPPILLLHLWVATFLQVVMTISLFTVNVEEEVMAIMEVHLV